MILPAPGLPRGPRHLFRLGVVLLAIFAGATVAGAGAEPAFNVYLFGALHVVVLAVLVWRLVAGGPGRGVALGFTVAVAAWLFGWLYYFIAFDGLEKIPYPSVSDGLWLCFYPGCCGALVALLRSSVAKEMERRFWADGALMAIVLTGVALTVVVHPLTEATGGDGAAVLTNLAYPLGDVALLSLVLALVALRGWRWGPQLRLVGLAFVAQVVADAVWLSLNAAGVYERGTPLDAVYPAVALMFAAAAWKPGPEVAPAAPVNRLMLTAVTATLAILLLAWGTQNPIPPATTLLALATLLGCGVRAAFLTRQIDALRRSRDEALAAAHSDELTGLGNRRAFLERLEGAATDARSAGAPLSLLMFNLRRLRQTNLSHGSQAGDDRVRGLAARLEAAAGRDGSAHRLEGATLALILPGVHTWNAFLLAQELHEPGHQGGVAAGVAGLVRGLGPEDLIQRADAALLEARRAHREAVMWSPDLEPRPRTVEEEEARRHHRTLATALARAVDAKDSYTRSHSETVAECCVLIGRRLELDGDRLAALRLGGLLHDVGKIGIPDAILQKPGALTEEEWLVMRSHSRLGADIVLGAELEEQADWVLHHHERLDGKGYPDRLAAGSIPLESRIIHVADAYEAMTSDRPYRRGRPPEEALEELRRHAGTQFDPACVEALCSALSEGDRPGDAAVSGPEPQATAETAHAILAASTRAAVPVHTATPPAGPRAATIPRSVRTLLALLVLATVVCAGRLALIPGAVDRPVDTWFYNGILLVSGLVAAAAGRRPRRNRAGLLLGLGLVCWGSGNVIFSAMDAMGDVPVPSVADPLYLLFDAFVFLAMGSVVARAARRRGVGVWLDGAVISLGAMAVLATTVLSGALGGGDGVDLLARLTTLAYPLGDLLLLGVLAALASLGVRHRGHAWWCLAAGTLAFMVSDSQFMLQVAAGTYETGGPTDIGWLLAGPCFAAAAWSPIGVEGASAEERPGQMFAAAAFGLLALVLLVVDHFSRLNGFAVWLSFATGIAVVARAAHAFRERRHLLTTSRHEALTDSLTGLANRRALLAALDGRLRGPAIGDAALVLFDLDGFKAYNDRFGHPAGDALLARLGRRFAESLPAAGSAFRMGGDEFCAIVPLGSGLRAEQVGAAAALALGEANGDLEITASWGEVTLPAEATDAAEALRIADGRLYDRKRAFHGSTRRAPVVAGLAPDPLAGPRRDSRAACAPQRPRQP